MNRVTSLLNISFPMIQAGMVWCSGWRLAAASSNAGILGVIGSGSMYPEVLREHIVKCKAATVHPFGVNIPLMYPSVDEHINHIVKEGVSVVITSAGNPATFTQKLKDQGITVIHVVSSSKFAEKAEKAGVDAIVCEGFEAGGHNGREETTTMCLVPEVRKATGLPVIAAGGIGSGASMAAAFALGAEAVQIGSLFVTAEESSAHDNFKRAVIHAKEGDTLLTLKELTPVRLLKNKFYEQIFEAYKNNADNEQLKSLLGRGRAKKGMFQGDLSAGELEIGQVSASIDRIETVFEIVDRLLKEYEEARLGLRPIKY